MLSAAQDFDQAWETRDEDGTFHGAFSWALIRAMRDSSAGESASETFLRARILEWDGVRKRSPSSLTMPAWSIERLVVESVPSRRHKAGSGVSEKTRGSRMAQYKYRERLQHSSSAAFDTRHAPGTTAQNPGIYRCPGCGDEIAIAKGHTLPPQNHHQHAAHQGKVEWQLLVYAEQSK